MYSPKQYNTLGVAFVSDDLPKQVQKKVNQKMEELEGEMEMLQQKIRAEFDKWLDGYGLEQAMGVIIKKDYAHGRKEKAGTGCRN